VQAAVNKTVAMANTPMADSKEAVMASKSGDGGQQ
jgi:hypothetical protein